MATKTSLLGLTKPAYTDAVDIAVLNTNFDLIDKAVGNGKHAKNWADNGFFPSAFVVNQRGAVSVTTGWTYFIDRWLAPSASEATPISLNGSGLTINNAAGTSTMSLRQYIANMPDGVYTAAAKCNGNLWTRQFTLLDGSMSAASNHSDSTGQLYISGTGASLAFNLQVFSGKSGLFEWAALYEGAYDADTLPAYVYKGYAAELAECMRYYQVFGKKRLVQSTQPNGGFSISERFAIPMRVAPTIKGTYVAWSTVASGNTVVEQTAALATSESRADGFRGYYTVGIATELMMLDYAFAASADL